MALETVREQNAEQSQILAPIRGVTKAVLYARVSTDKQREEATIESQLFELKRQIAALASLPRLVPGFEYPAFQALKVSADMLKRARDACEASRRDAYVSGSNAGCFLASGATSFS